MSCKTDPEQSGPDDEEIKSSDTLEIKYATGFKLQKTDDGYALTITDPWPGADREYEYHLTKNPTSENDIQIPVKKLIATSTTHIPPLDLLAVSESLVGFPSTDYVSSRIVRKLIYAGKVEDLGMDQSINVERTIQLQPDAVMAYGVESASKNYDKITKAGIPVVFNGDWTEGHPLGKAEWIKLYGALYGKEKMADSIFRAIENEYMTLSNQVQDLKKPSVLAGATYRDTWYLPYGDSWQGKILADAGADYIYADTSGSGSLAYNLETVLNDGQAAEFWIAPGQYTSYSSMKSDLAAYEKFDAFQKKQVYTFALTTGAKGGVTYYEEASMRPDIVLKDLVKILHPDFELEHELYFFQKLNP